MSSHEEKSSLEFTYSFSRRETELLAKYIRKNMLPDGLEKFRDTIYASIYSCMTIDEAEAFFRD